MKTCFNKLNKGLCLEKLKISQWFHAIFRILISRAIYPKIGSTDIFNSFNLSSEDAKKYDVVVSKFENHFSPKKNLTVLRHKFLNRKQLPSESIDSFYTDLVNLSLACEFDSVRESLVCDVLISGLNSQNQNVRERLLREPEINLEKTLAICKAAELSKQHIRELEAEHNVHTVNVHKQRERGYQQPQTFRQKQVHQDQRNKFHPPSQQKSTGTGRPNKSTSAKKFISNCRNCGKNHGINKCSAYGLVCYKCGKNNHFASVCKSAKKVCEVGLSLDSNSSDVAIRQGRQDSSSKSTCAQEYFSIDTVSLTSESIPNYVIDKNFLFSNICSVNDSVPKNYMCKARANEWLENLNIREHTISFKIDTGAQTNIIPIDLFNRLGLSKALIRTSNINLSTLTGEKIPA
ncbi:uncharacterized protein LOC128999869 [Macrosteles quadrilineatus]|uniref:uncharacterized protein LOC128999869 n=1 Tax=Macrosteles quadrilineatus TaxID=74068 RepID=UPI0023E30905|nr:uncharacterized protein LOC128999869 [Macrosteles quadrilineatus]